MNSIDRNISQNQQNGSQQLDAPSSSWGSSFYQKFFAPIVNGTSNLISKSLSVAKSGFHYANVAGGILLNAGMDIVDPLKKHSEPTMKDHLERIKQAQGEQFGQVCQALGDKIGDLAVKVYPSIKEKLEVDFKFKSQWPGLSHLYEKVLNPTIGYYLDRSDDYIKSVAKANFLSVMANLSEAADQKNLSDQIKKDDPLVAILAVLGQPYEARIQEIAKIELIVDAKEKENQLKKVFGAIAQDLLALAFPNQEEDIEIFEEGLGLPLSSYLKASIWQAVQQKGQELPQLFYQLYQEMKVSDTLQGPEWKDREGKEWRKEFDQAIGIADAHKLEKAPSFALNYFPTTEHLNSVQSFLEEFLTDQKQPSKTKAAHLSNYMVRMLQSLLKTENETIRNAGSFLEKYVMTKLLCNFMQPCSTKLPSIPDAAIKVIPALEKFKDPKNSQAGAKDLLALFGLDRKETFPLPPIIKDLLPDHFVDIAHEKLGQFLDTQIKDIHSLLLQKNYHQNKLLVKTEKSTSLKNQLVSAAKNPSLNELEKLKLREKIEITKDQSLVEYCRLAARKAVEKGLGFVVSPPFNLKEVLGKSLPISLTNHQWDDLHVQLTHLLLLKSTRKPIQTFLEDYLESFFLQMVSHLQDRIQLKDGQVGPWLAAEITQEFKKIVRENTSTEELGLLSRAIRLKNEIAASQNKADKKVKEEKLKKIWPRIAPKFEALAHFVLQKVNIISADSLAVPALLKEGVWNVIQEQMPHLLFEQASDLLLPVAEKHINEKKLNAYPNEQEPIGHEVIPFCRSLAQDIRSLIPTLIDDYRLIARDINEIVLEEGLDEQQVKDFGNRIAQLVKNRDVKIKNLLSIIHSYRKEGPYSKAQQIAIKTKLIEYKKRIKAVLITPQELLKDLPSGATTRACREHLSQEVLALVKNKDSSYDGIWSCVEDYIEGIFLKIAVKFSEFDQEKWNKIQAFILSQKELIAGKPPQEAKAILGSALKVFLDQFLDINERNLPGVPPLLRAPLLSLITDFITGKLTDSYQVYHSLRNYNIKEKELEEIGGDDLLTKSCHSLTRFLFSAVPQTLNQKKNGRKQGEVFLTKKLAQLVDKGEEAQLKTATVAKDLLSRRSSTPFFNSVINLLNADEAEKTKDEIASFAANILKKPFANLMKPILEQEKAGKEAFDQEWLIKLLPLLLNHLKVLNITGKEDSNLPFDRFAANCRENLHEALRGVGSEEQKEAHKLDKFYKPYAQDLLKVLFPGGKKDLMELYSLPPDVCNLVWKQLKEQTPQLLSEAMNNIFTPGNIRTILTAIFQKAIQNFDKAIEDLPNQQQPVRGYQIPLTEEALERKQKIDHLIGQFVIEAGNFFNLRVTRLNDLPPAIKNLFKIDELETASVDVISSALLKVFNGNFFAESLKEGLNALAEKKAHKVSEEELALIEAKEKEELQNLGHRFVDKGVEFAFESVKLKLHQLLERILPGRVGEFIRTVIEYIFHIVFVVGLGGLLRLLGLSAWFSRKVHAYFDSRLDKLANVLGKGDLHQNLVMQSVDTSLELFASA
jgi:hypothetical protein